MEKSLYCTDPDSYLRRARHCLDQANTDFLFYAAYELRCFVETRQEEYLHFQESYRRSLPKRWNVGKQAAELKKIFGREDMQVAIIRYPDEYEYEASHIPVSPSLQKSVEQLGRLLHSQDGDIDNAKAVLLRRALTTIWDAASECNSGNLMSPILRNEEDGRPIGEIKLKLKKDEAEAFMERNKKGSQITISVGYRDLNVKIEDDILRLLR